MDCDHTGTTNGQRGVPSTRARARRSVTARLSGYCLQSLLVAPLLVPISQANVDTFSARTIGEAFDRNSGELLYSETHCVSPDALTREVIYRNAQEDLIAYKVLKYETGPTTPSFEQHNLQSHESVAIALQRDEILISASENSAGGEGSSVSLVPSDESPLVIDAGFDAFVRENWGSLVAGQGKRFQFPLAAREMLVKLRIESAPCSYDTQTDQCFTLEMDNWLLSLVADPIELGYDARLQRLTRFRGVSNISDDSGAGLVVDIHYKYHDLAALQCDK